MNRTSEALESAQAAVKLAPGEPSALEQLCSTQVQVTKFDEARVCYENLSKLTTLDPISQTSYGVALLRSGRNQEAIAVLQKTAAMSPANSQTLNALGVAYFDGKRFADAILAFKEAVELGPDQHAIRFNLALAYLSGGNKEGALSQYRLLKQDDPKLAEQLYLIIFRDKVVSVDELRKH
jgi:Flp pilus assembly protein TadD